MEEGHTNITQAVRALRQGGVVAFPTETYYGLAVDPFNEDALEHLFRVKGRARNKPMLVLVDDKTQIHSLATSVPSCYNKLMRRFWPGPLTLVFPARRELSSLLTGGLGTIGIRESPHPLARELVHTFGRPITATSANRSGGLPALSAVEVLRIFPSGVDVVIGDTLPPCEKGSTLVGWEQDRIFCIREGQIPFQKITEALDNNLTTTG